MNGTPIWVSNRHSGPIAPNDKSRSNNPILLIETGLLHHLYDSQY